MKKNYIMGVIACAALTMTSCSNDEIGGKNSQQHITVQEICLILCTIKLLQKKGLHGLIAL